MNSPEVLTPERATTCWDRLVDTYADQVWEVIRAARLPRDAAMAANQLTWTRLADNIAAIAPVDIEEWLRGTARREAERSAKLIRITG